MSKKKNEIGSGVHSEYAENKKSIADLLEENEENEDDPNPNDLTNLDNCRRFASEMKAGAASGGVKMFNVEISDKVVLADAKGKKVGDYEFLSPTENRFVIIKIEENKAFCLSTEQTVAQRKDKPDLITFHYREIPVECGFALMRIFDTTQVK